MADAGWLPDPSGAHELRYWDGGTWTEHVSDAGATSQDPPSAPLPPPAPPAAVPPPPPPPLAGPRPAETVPAGRVSWKDRLKQVADQGKAAVDQGKAKLAEQGAKRAEQWANDPSTLWYGESQNAATSAAGVAKARYRITRDRVWIESGLLGTRTESVPLWAIRDMDVRQAVWQRDKDVGDVVLNLEDPAYGAQQGMFSMTGGGEHGRTSGQTVLDNIEHPFAVLELLAPLVSEARTKKTIERQSQYVHMQPPMGAPYPAPMAPPMAPPVVPAPAEPSEPKLDLADQLRKLADLRDAGVLTDDEFSSQKAKLLG
jgi:hypothetical protein